MATDTKQLHLPGIDGHRVGKIAVSVSGRVFLDMDNPNDVALFKNLTLGKDVSLTIEGKVAKKIGEFTTDKDGDLDVVQEHRRIKVHTVYVPDSQEA